MAWISAKPLYISSLVLALLGDFGLTILHKVSFLLSTVTGDFVVERGKTVLSTAVLTSVAKNSAKFLRFL